MTTRQTKIRLTKKESPWLLIIMVLPYVLFALTAFLEFSETVDDPYITLRYSHNLLFGHGPVFNLGERVEGYSSILHLLICSFLLIVFPMADALFKAKLTSLAFGFGVLFLTGKLADLAGLKGNIRITSQVLVAININFAIASVNGLETTLYGFLLLFSIILFLSECKAKTGYRSAFFLFLTVLARPDAIIMFVFLFFVRLYWRFRLTLPATFITYWLLWFSLLICLLTVCRWEYYHSLLPNTYFAKQLSLNSTIMPGFKYLSRSLFSEAPSFLHHRITLIEIYQVIYALLFWALAGLGLLHLRQRLEGAVFSAVIGAAFVFVIKAGGDWMPGWRFMVPVLPLISILQCCSCQTLQKWYEKRNGNFKPGPYMPYWNVALVGFWGLAFVIAPHCSWSKARFSTKGQDILAASDEGGKFWVGVGNYINEKLPAGASIAYSEMGYAGFLNQDKHFIDTRGLTDHEIALMPNKFKGNTGVNDLEWTKPDDPLYQILKRRRPDFILSRDGGVQSTVLQNYVYVPVDDIKSDSITALRVYRLTK